MIEERYCSYEVSNLLQEKGFNQECFAKYAKEACTERYYDDYRERMLSWTIRPGELIIPSIDRESYEVYGVMIPAPTHQMACDWLREVHHIYIEICFYKTNPNDIEPKKSRLSPYYTFGVWDTISGNNIDKRLTNDFIGDSYKEAVEAALKYVLENLI